MPDDFDKIPEHKNLRKGPHPHLVLHRPHRHGTADCFVCLACGCTWRDQPPIISIRVPDTLKNEVLARYAHRARKGEPVSLRELYEEEDYVPDTDPTQHDSEKE